MICAQCHSFRDIYADGFKAGANYYDYFLPVMEYRLPAVRGPCLLARRAAAVVRERCSRIVAERVFPEGRRYLRHLPLAPAQYGY